MKISHNTETLKVNEGPPEINVDVAFVLPWVSVLSSSGPGPRSGPGQVQVQVRSRSGPGHSG